MILILCLYTTTLLSACHVTNWEGLQTLLCNHHEPTCILIHSPECRLSGLITPPFHETATNPEWQAHMQFFTIDFDAIKEFNTTYNITKTPTICIFDQEGNLISKKEGIKNKNTIKQDLEKSIARALSLKQTTKNGIFEKIKKNIPSFEEIQAWLTFQCKTCLITIRNGIDYCIEICFN